MSNNLATTALFMTNASSELYPASVGSNEARFIHFILNERTRELCGEFYRWEDLVRTETFYDRTKLYNADISASFCAVSQVEAYTVFANDCANNKWSPDVCSGYDFVSKSRLLIFLSCKQSLT